ncbi:hypothetical protein DH2020_022814 [Rehmannia glutinosa]|uniref:KIB1-4 beta-propeller domain-containing protein n=1 Tax=Rehmannia glutinosa TaxID=99300 RepID=A0ABR0W6W8_REHGL
MLTYGPTQKLAFCCPSRATGWSPIGEPRSYESFVYSKRQNLFFCTTYYDSELKLEAWDIRDPQSPRLIPMELSPMLVADQLYLDGALKVMCRSLDSMAIFVGSNHGRALSASEYPCLNPNSIYFTEPQSDGRFISGADDLDHGGHDLGIFDYENETFSPCYYPCDVQSMKRIEPVPMWFTPTHLPTV